MVSAVSGVSWFCVSVLRRSFLPSPVLFSSSSLPLSLPRVRTSAVSTHLMRAQGSSSADVSPPPPLQKFGRWKPMCLYYTQGKCTMLNDLAHLEKFSHCCSKELQVNTADTKRVRSQHLDFFLVLDLEGKIEILEFPVLLINARTLEVVDFFHRFVRPSEMSELRLNNYVQGKYGKFGVDRVWHDTAVPFNEVIQQFEAWTTLHRLWGEGQSKHLHQAAFVTCGNWDLKTKIPQQCKVSRLKLPAYFQEWINLKDVYLNFYQRRATGMMTMMRELQIPLFGSHHLGIDDTKNITKVLQRMLIDGAVMQITARRNPDASENVEFLFKNRIG